VQAVYELFGGTLFGWFQPVASDYYRPHDEAAGSLQNPCQPAFYRKGFYFSCYMRLAKAYSMK